MDFWSAVSGIEQVLWDLAGKRLGVPVVSLLGGPCRERIRVYANGWYSGARTPDAYAAKAKETVARGFRALRFDSFPGPWRTHISREAAQQVVETVRAVREAVGPTVDLLIEVHRAEVTAKVPLVTEQEIDAIRQTKAASAATTQRRANRFAPIYRSRN